jgi:hypothetical protein
LNKFQESQNTPKSRLQHSQTSRSKIAQNRPRKSSKKEKLEEEKDKLEISANNLIKQP